LEIPFAGQREYAEWFSDFCAKKWDFKHIVVSSHNGFSIPLVVHDGNAYDPAYGSACLWSYFSPGYFEDRPKPIRPELLQFGSFPMALTGNKDYEALKNQP